jgi:hypothetical protein
VAVDEAAITKEVHGVYDMATDHTLCRTMLQLNRIEAKAKKIKLPKFEISKGPFGTFWAGRRGHGQLGLFWSGRACCKWETKANAIAKGQVAPMVYLMEYPVDGSWLRYVEATKGEPDFTEADAERIGRKAYMVAEAMVNVRAELIVPNQHTPGRAPDLPPRV